jgi:hypothetical protein
MITTSWYGAKISFPTAEKTSASAAAGEEHVRRSMLDVYRVTCQDPNGLHRCESMFRRRTAMQVSS